MSRVADLTVRHTASIAQPLVGLAPTSPFSSFARLRIAVSTMAFGAGCVVSTYAYDSLSPTLVALVSLIVSLAILLVCGCTDSFQWQAFVQVFSVCWFWAAIAAVFTMSNEDFSDAIYFYDEVTTGSGSWQELSDTLFDTENGGAIVLWRLFYNAFACLGVREAPFIGVTLNICLIAATSVVGVKIVNAVYGGDQRRIFLFTSLCTLCGLFWLYASIHIRDAAVLFATTLLMLAWVRYLGHRSLHNGILLAVATVVLLQTFSFLRREFFFVPIAMACAGTAALGAATQRGSKLAAILIIATAVAVLVQARWSVELQDDAVELADINRQGYGDLSRLESGSQSLGSSLIMSQPPPLRVALGSVYVLVFPIPCWVGFQRESAYHLFKSLHVLLMYAVLPLFVLALWRLIRIRSLRTPQTLFLAFTVVGFLASVSYTSLETRHFGAFFVAFLALSLVPDLSRSRDRLAYRRLLTLFLIGVSGIHMLWFLVKGGF